MPELISSSFQCDCSHQVPVPLDASPGLLVRCPDCRQAYALVSGACGQAWATVDDVEVRKFRLFNDPKDAAMELRVREDGESSEDYMARPYNIIITLNDGDGVSGCVAELPGCLTCGDSPDIVLQKTIRLMKSWIQVALDLGHAIPEPVCSSEIVSFIKSRERDPS